MPSKDRAKAREHAVRIVQWLGEHQAQFEGEGIREDSLAAAVGLPPADVAAAVDTLENKEEIVRVPVTHTAPQQFTLTPGRAWKHVRVEAPRTTAR